MDPLLLGTATAFGLAASAGLNTTLPLLIVGILARVGLLTLGPPFDALASDVALAGLFLLAGLEFLSDKVPAWDTLVQTVQWPLTAAAGAILFASQTSVISWVHPGLAILVGLLTASTVHAVRVAVRPGVTTLTAGLGNSVVSTAEDAYAIALAGAALFAPVIGFLLFLGLLVIAGLTGAWAVQRGLRLTRWLRHLADDRRA